jgi:hypothetical protein
LTLILGEFQVSTSNLTEVLHDVSREAAFKMLRGKWFDQVDRSIPIVINNYYRIWHETLYYNIISRLALDKIFFQKSRLAAPKFGGRFLTGFYKDFSGIPEL